MAAAKYYAWSDIYNGGEVEDVQLPNGAVRTVVTKRNIVLRGEAVKKAQFSDEEWDSLVDGGSVRPYPLPEEADDFLSPTQAILARLSGGTGEIDPAVLVELALAHPPSAVVEEPVLEPVAEGT